MDKLLAFTKITGTIILFVAAGTSDSGKLSLGATAGMVLLGCALISSGMAAAALAAWIRRRAHCRRLRRARPRSPRGAA